jgi:hypothetical protein
MEIIIFFRNIASSSPYMNHVLALWFLARLIFDLDDGCGTFPRNVGSYAYYTALYTTRKLLLP